MATNNRPFSRYATYYDVIYADKDYEGEARFVSSLIGKFLPGKKKKVRVLDLACGTGRHTFALTKLKYRVDGADLSRDMINIARKEAKRHNINARFFLESFQSCGNINGKYDVVIAMFSAIGYLKAYRDLALALRNVSALLKKDGLFIFDVWNGNAVVNDYSPARVKRMVKDGTKIVRRSKTKINRISQVATVDFKFLVFKNRKIIDRFSERHLVRFFFLREMVDLLQANGFTVIARCPFMTHERDAKLNDWNVTYVATKTAKAARS